VGGGEEGMVNVLRDDIGVRQNIFLLKALQKNDYKKKRRGKVTVIRKEKGLYGGTCWRKWRRNH